MSKQNPFFGDDLVASVARDTASVQSKQQASLQTFLKSQSTKTYQNQPTPKPTFNLNNFMTFNFTHFTKYSIAGLAVFTLLAGGIATQALALENLKPTQVVQTIKDKYFSANKQTDGDPKTALVGDDENYVSNLDGCEMSIKYSKKSNLSNVETNIAKDRSVFYFHPLNYTEDALQIECIKNTADEYYYSSLDSLLKLNLPDLITKPITNKELSDSTGWFISETGFIDLIKTTTGKAVRYDILNTKTKQKIIIGIINTETIKPVDFQLQFNFSVNNVSNRDLAILESEICTYAILQAEAKPTKITSLNNNDRYSYYWDNVALANANFDRVAMECSTSSKKISDLTEGQTKKFEQIYDLKSILKVEYFDKVKQNTVRSFTGIKNSHCISFELENGNIYLLYLIK